MCMPGYAMMGRGGNVQYLKKKLAEKQNLLTFHQSTVVNLFLLELYFSLIDVTIFSCFLYVRESTYMSVQFLLE